MKIPKKMIFDFARVRIISVPLGIGFVMQREAKRGNMT